MPEPTSPIVVSDHSVPLVHLSLAVKRGSLFDPIGKEGATRLLVRLMRRSVVGMGAEQIDEHLDTMGASLGIDANRSVAGFHGGSLTRSVPAFLDMVRRVVTEPHWDSVEFERIKEEAHAEWVESLDNDSAIARRFFSRRLFRDHPYGRLTGGTPESLARITLDDLKALYSQLLTGEAVQMAFAGDVLPDQAARFFENVTRALPDGSEAPDGADDPTGPQGRHLTFIDKPERSQSQILIGGLGTHTGDPDHTALFIGHTIFGGTFSGRLSREVRGKRGWSYGAYSDLPFDRKRQAFSLWTFPQAADAAECIKLELSLLQEFIEQGITKSELSAAKKYLANSHVFSVDTAEKRASAAIDRHLYDLPSGYHSEYVDRVKAVTIDEVNTALLRRLSFKNLQITVLGTEAEIGGDVRNAIEDLASAEIVPYNITA